MPKDNVGEGVEKVIEVLAEKANRGGQKKLLDKEINQIIAISKHLKKNWKTALPAIAAIGVGAYLLKMKKSKKPKKTAKKPAKRKSKKK